MMTKKKMIILAVTALLATNLLYAQSDIGIDYYRLGDLIKAKEFLTRDLATNPALNNYYLGEIAFAENNPAQAAEYYAKGLAADPESLLNQIGQLKLKLKSDPQGTEKLLTALSKKAKKDVDAQIAIARAYLDNGMLAQANKQYDAAHKAGSKNPAVYILEGDIKLKEGSDSKKLGEAAGKYDQAVYFDPNYLLGYMKSAEVYEKINSGLAIEKMKTVIEKNPNYMPALGLIGRIYTQNGFYPEAIATYKKYIASGVYSIDDLAKYVWAEFYVEPASGDPKDKDYTEAKKIVQQGLQLDPNHFALNRFLMYIDAKTAQTDDGLAVADKFFKIRNDTSYIDQDYLNYALLLTQAKRYDDAYASFDKAVALAADKDKLRIYDEAASTAGDAKDYVKAAEYIQQKIKEAIKQSDDPEFKGTLVDITTMGYDYFLAGNASAKNLSAAEELMKNPAIVDMVKTSVAGVLPDSLNDVNYFARAYGKYYLTKADSVFDVQIAMAPESYQGYRLKAQAKHGLNPDYKAGDAKPHYEKVIEILTQPDNELTPATKRVLLEAYTSLGYHYYLNDDKANTILYFTKVLELEPGEAQAKQAKDIIDDVNKNLK
ncbi:MAG: hypothetical protein LBE91_00290 [Tannerella sp.]|jgi:tetratricopeptide (TPR) repeat protein|nr:hypothetical protein [Tannerella sp.]